MSIEACWIRKIKQEITEMVTTAGGNTDSPHRETENPEQARGHHPCASTADFGVCG
jgi:hypothetical protein